MSLRFIEKPTIAAINGACAGAGMGWACACDLRFASATAIFRTAFVTAGLSGDYGLSWTLPRIVGGARARELFLLNQKVLPATLHDAPTLLTSLDAGRHLARWLFNR